MLQPEIINESNTIGHQTIPEDGYCKTFGFCMSVACKYEKTCKLIRAPLLLYCIIVDEKNRSYYPIQYANELTLIPEEVRAETTIVEQCAGNNCNKTIFFSRIFRDTYIKYAEEQGKKFNIYCCQKMHG